MNIYDNYTHIKCDCGGILGLYDREHCTCERCKKEYTNIRYDLLAINDKNGWIFPMVAKNTEEHQKRIESKTIRRQYAILYLRNIEGWQ